MNSPSELDTGPLSWVKDEIELALGRVAEQLQKYAGRQDPAVLGDARTYLHQSHGALAIVGLDGITEFSRAIERLLEALAKGEVPWSHALGEAAQEGLSALRQYLDELINGRPNQPLRLLPAYRRLNQARGAQDVAASELFFPDLTQRPPRRESLSSALDESARQTRLKAARLGFERGLAKWFRQDTGNESAGLRDMRNSIAMIEALQTQPATRAFWWVTLAYFDALAAGGIAGDDVTRRLCGRIDAQIRKLLDGTAAVAERLMRDVLYEVATASASNPHIEQVRSAYRLREMVPSAAAENDSRSMPLHEMRECLAAASESWDQFCTGAAIALPRFHEQSAQLVTLAQQLGHVDLARLVAGLANMANLLRKNPLLQDDTLAAEMALALLLTEKAITDFDRLDVDFAAQVDVVTVRLTTLQRSQPLAPLALPSLQLLAQKAGNRIAMQQMAHGLRAQLHQVEQGLDAFFRDSANSTALDGVTRLLHKIAAVFVQIDQSRAVEVVRDCASSIDGFAAPDLERQPGEFEAVARKISALGFFVDQLPRGPVDLDALLTTPPPAAAELHAVPTVEAELSQQALMTRTLVGFMTGKEGPAPQDEKARESLRVELKQNLEGMRDNARLVADESIERQADAALSALDSEASAEQIEQIVAPLTVDISLDVGLPVTESARLAEASAAEVDSELLGIFIEEVLQVLDTVGVQLYRSMAKPDQSEHLSILRRCFHTLKGSSRMVGLQDFSAAALAVETTLGRHLQSEQPATAELHAMVDTAQHIVSDWVERLQRRASSPDMTPLLRQCAALKQQYQEQAQEGDVDTTVAAADGSKAASVEQGRADQARASVSIGPLQVPRALYEIYLNEARGHLATLQQNWQRTPTQLMIRAAHTLAGTSATLGLAPVQLLAQALELALERFALAAVVPDTTQESALHLALRRLATMVASVAEQRLPPADDELAAQLGALQPGPEQNVAGVNGEAAEQGSNMDAAHDVLPLFLEESQDLIPAIAAAFRGWRGQDNNSDNNTGNAAGQESSQGVESLQRLLHTLKGSARMAGLTEIGAAVHDIETRIAAALAEGSVPPLLIDTLETEFDKAAALIDALRIGPQTAGDVQRPMLRVRADLVDTMVNASGEIAIARSRVEGGSKSLRASLGELNENVARLRAYLRELEIEADSSIQSQIQSRSALARDRNFDPLEMDRYTRLQELTRILAESVNDVATVEHGLMRDLDQVDAALTQQARLSRELTQRLMGVRMVPFASIAERLQRVVRLTADELGKNVGFAIEGGETELDRSVLERMTGPIEHLLRNAVAHGIETSEERRAAGKAKQGTVRLVLVQAGNEVEICVSDDGAGLDYERIRSVAIKRGLLTADQPADEAQLLQLIYLPGFTTASERSAIAGGGVGMDVVRTETTALGGRIEVCAEAQRGTSFALHLPLTLAVIPSLLVKSGSRSYAIPSAMVMHASEVKPDEIVRLRAAAMTEWQGQRYALHYLPRLLGDVAAQPSPQRRHWVIMLRGGVQRIALEVDSLIGNEEVVIKNIGPQLARVPGISGVTVLADGEVVLIVNPVTLAGKGANRQAPPASRQTRDVKAAVTPATVMVVDDSLTVRKISGRLLERAGYRVMTAKDGVDALEQLAEALPAVILADIEMPHMDGFELLRRVRDDARLKSLPVIMITSRTADKHRNYAMELGANHYLGKPYDEEALLAMIAEYVGK